jgi:hypothetical protein
LEECHKDDPLLTSSQTSPIFLSVALVIAVIVTPLMKSQAQKQPAEKEPLP